MPWKNFLTYAVVLLVFGGGVVVTLYLGEREPLRVRSGVEPSPVPNEVAFQRDPLSVLLLQIIVIIVTAKAVGWVFRHIGQPAVIGEMVAGILLGPSLLQSVFPAGFAFLFPD